MTLPAFAAAAMGVHAYGQMGSADPPPGKMDEKLKSENMQKEQFSEWGGGEWGERRYADHIYSDILQNAPFRSQIFFT